MANNSSILDMVQMQEKAYHIEELLHKITPELSNLMIIEDAEDTKKITLEELLRFFITNNEINKLKTYSSSKIESIISELKTLIDNKAASDKVSNLETRIANIIASNGTGKDSEIVDARGSYSTLGQRLNTQYNYLDTIKASITKRQVTITRDSGSYVISNDRSIGDIQCIVNDGTNGENKYTITSYSMSGNVLTSITAQNKTSTIVNCTDSYIKFEWDPESIEYVQFTYDVYDVDLDYLLNKINELNQYLINKHDNCGLLSSIGTYKSISDPLLISPSDIYNCTLDTDNSKIRNGSNSIKITPNKDVTRLYFRYPMNMDININTATFIFYIDGDTIEKMLDTDTIDICLAYESVESNYYTYSITKNELIPGWNNLKKLISDFTKVGNITDNKVDHIKIEMNGTNLTNINIWFNGITFNQMMKPKVLLCFNGFYDDCVESVYPYLVAKDIPATVFINDNTTLLDQTMDKLVDLKCSNRWSIGAYGCHPNKELLTLYDNPREQYMLLKDTKDFVESNYCYSPISYSAPFGKIRNITVPLLKDFNYKMARVETVNPVYISTFTENDFAFPVIECSNTVSIDQIKDYISYAISTGQSIALYTSHITEYGDEAALSQTDFELLVDYLYELSKVGQIECLSIDDFYNQCIN